MARGVNKVILIGHLGKDPEVKYFPNGDAFCNVSLATSESWTDKQSGEKKERTEWHNIVFTKKLAEIVGEYLKKGSKVYVEGSLRTRKWEKDGTERYTTEVVVQDMQMLDSRPSEGQGQATGQSDRSRQQDAEKTRANANDYSRASGRSSRPAQQPPQRAPVDDGGFSDDDIPF